MTTSPVQQFPPELLSLICAYVYAADLPPEPSSLDPLIPSNGSVPIALPSSYPAAYWTDAAVRLTLHNLCLVNHAWYDAAKPWLWHKVEVRLPRDWLSLVEEIAGGEEDEEMDEALLVDQTIQEATSAALATKHIFDDQSDADLAKELHERLLATLTGPDGSIPPELLSPPATRDPSPRRLRAKSKSPARWKLVRSITDAVQNVMLQDHPGIYVPVPHDPRPGRFIRYIDFNHFRTIGMRRSVEEGVNNRFVTPDRLATVLKQMSNLKAFGATEYMDGALNSAVIQELFLRGSLYRGRGRPSRGRDLIIHYSDDPEEEDRERRRECKELEALDLTGCVSAVFVKALTDFVNTHIISPPGSDSDESDNEDPRVRLRARTADAEPLIFPGLRRLGLRGVKSVQPHILNALVLAFPNLTHLDLSCTRITPDLLAALGSSTTVHLKSLALERCNWLTGESIAKFLIDANCTRDLRELSLFGDGTFPSPLSEEELGDIFARAPCFLSGELRYLDLSSSPVTKEMLLDVAVAQPNLRSLGFSHIHNLSLSAIAEFLRTKALHVEILTLVNTAPEFGYGNDYVSARQATIALHAQLIRPLCTPPFTFSLTGSTKKAEPPTRLRVIELAPPLLAGLGVGADAWRIVKSKGGRGWYVDTASGWIAKACGEDGCEGRSVLRRDLPPGHPWRTELERLSDANGNVSSGIGWHSRKMEILHGYGLLGRESGLYGAVAFAYQG